MSEIEIPPGNAPEGPLSRSVKRSTALVKMFGLYAAAIVSALVSVALAGETIRENLNISEQWMVALVFSVPMLAIFFLETVPIWIQDRRKKHLESIGETFGTAEIKPRYFRLTPYSERQEDREAFKRADGAHERLFDWLNTTREPVVYLSGRSGCGKSSCMNAYVIPKLRESDVHVLYVRGYEDPVEALRSKLLEAGAVWERLPRNLPEDPKELLISAGRYLDRKRLLVVFDQFEEFLIIHQEDKDRLTAFNNLLASLKADRIPNLCLLLVLRTDYVRPLTELDACQLVSDVNWQDIRSFNIIESRTFLRNSGLKLQEKVEDRIIKQLSEIEETKGFIRPVSLNMMGLMLTQMDRELTGKLVGRRVWTPDLLSEYLRNCLRAKEVEDAPAIIRNMITKAGTKLPASLDTLSEKTGLGQRHVKGCLMLLQRNSLVRPLDKAGNWWEVSHDFLARLLDQVLATWRETLWRKVQPMLGIIALVLWMGILLGGFHIMIPSCITTLEIGLLN